MAQRPRVGESIVHRVTVTPEMTARLFDREIHPVYATASMVRHVEEAGRMLVERYLGPGEDATGYSIELTHERPAFVGHRLEVVATVTAADDRECAAEVVVRGPTGVVGRARFVQRYVPAGHFGHEVGRRGGRGTD